MGEFSFEEDGRDGLVLLEALKDEGVRKIWRVLR